MESQLSEEELEVCPRSYEAIGDIAVIEIPEELESKETLIGETLLENHKNIRAVFKKSSERSGEFRLKEYKKLAGEGGTETLHKENYCMFYLDIANVYYSSRESTERLRISNLVEDEESVLVMGAGVGPFPITIAKNNEAHVVGVELNPDAVEYFERNIVKNKVTDKVTVAMADIREYATHHKREFDRVLITMPQQAHEFVKTAASCVKDGGILHLYLTEDDDNLDYLISRVELILREDKRAFKITNVHKVLPYSPRRHKICMEVRF